MNNQICDLIGKVKQENEKVEKLSKEKKLLVD